MTKARKILLLCISLLVILSGGAYLAIPKIAQNVIISAIEQDGSVVQEVVVNWSGPQLLTGVHGEHHLGTADIDIEIENSIFSLLFKSQPIKVQITGDAIIVLPQEVEESTKEVIVQPLTNTVAQQKVPIVFPKLDITLQLDTLTVEGEDSLFYNNVQGSLDVDPGQHFVAELSAETIFGGSINAACNAPSLINGSGELNAEGGGTISLKIENAQLPTINGVADWAISTFSGVITSPNMSESFSVAMNGSLTELDEERGNIFCKTQFIKSTKQGALTFGGWSVMGTVNVSEVPTTILAAFLDSAKIDALRDLGPTMSAKLSRPNGESLPFATFSTRDLTLSAIVDSDMGVLTDFKVEANIHSELLSTLTSGNLSGDPKVTIHLDRLVPVGSGENSLSGELHIVGELLYKPTNVNIEEVHASLDGDVLSRFLATSGSATLNGINSTFDAKLHSPNKNKLDGIEDLWKTIVDQLPRGNGQITLKNVSSTLLDTYIPDDRISATRDIGNTFSTTATLNWDTLDLAFESERVLASCVGEVKGDQLVGFNTVDATAVITSQLATLLAGTNINATSTLHVVAPSVDLEGNASFDITLDIGKQHTVLRGKTSRVLNHTNNDLHLHVAATGLSTHLLDAFCKTKGILSDTLGSPIAVEIIGENMLSNPVVRASGTSPNAAFETSLTFFDGKVSTTTNIPTLAELQLSQKLTRHLLKDLGPILSDIRSIKKPIELQITNASSLLRGDLSKLSADVMIDIGEVALDSGSLTMQLLPMFNTKHVEVIPAYFDKIYISIRNGIATYKEFKLTLANKYTIPYSGTINLVNRKLHLKTSVPLTGLGYSIKELRGLATDIDVPVLITGTIDNPIVDVDPSFDLAAILLELGVGRVLDDVFGGGKNNKPIDPVKLIEDLFGGN
jgi:hypothetical protein